MAGYQCHSFILGTMELYVCCRAFPTPDQREEDICVWLPRAKLDLTFVGGDHPLMELAFAGRTKTDWPLWLFAGASLVMFSLSKPMWIQNRHARAQLRILNQYIRGLRQLQTCVLLLLCHFDLGLQPPSSLQSVLFFCKSQF